MKVRLIALTSPTIAADGIRLSAEGLIVYCARVSNPGSQEAGDDPGRLIKYCISHRHWSIFEQASMTVEIETSRAVSAQMLRHRSFTFQEFSQRYAVPPLIEDFEVTPARGQDPKNRQGSTDDMPVSVKSWWSEHQDEVFGYASHLYRDAIGKGIAKEVARMILPMATTTRIYMNGSARSWIHYLESRTDPATQAEHRLVAEEIKKIFVVQFPLTSKALGWTNES